jgi:hypothetical protein
MLYAHSRVFPLVFKNYDIKSEKVAHTHNPRESTWEAGIGESQVRGQFGLHTKTMCQKPKNKLWP